MALAPLPLLDSVYIDTYFESDDFSMHCSFASRMPPLKSIVCPAAYIEEWTSQEVYQFFESLCSVHNISEASLESFRVAGCDLLQMSLEECQRLDPMNGAFFYNQIKSKRQDLSMSYTGSSSLSTPPSGDSYHSIPNLPMLAEPQHHNNWAVDGAPSTLQCHYPPEKLHDLTTLGFSNHYLLPEEGLPNPYHDDKVPPLRQEGEGWDDPMSLMPSPLYTIGQSVTSCREQRSSPPYHAATCSSDYEHIPPIDGTYYGNPSSPMYPEGHDIPGTLSGDSSPYPVSPLLEDIRSLNFEGPPNSSQLQMENQKTRKGREQKSQRKGSGTTKKRNGERGPKLYEFLWCLLLDPNTNPSIIRWESMENRVFRLVNQSELSKRWGERRPTTKDESLPYEHFARAIRYYYSKSVILSVRDKKLVYSFGEKTFQNLSEKFGPPS